MKAMGMFVSSLIVIDAFLISYYVGLHSRTVNVVDPSMKPVQPPAVVQPQSRPAIAPTDKTKSKGKEAKADHPTKAKSTKPAKSGKPGANSKTGYQKSKSKKTQD